MVTFPETVAAIIDHRLRPLFVEALEGFNISPAVAEAVYRQHIAPEIDDIAQRAHLSDLSEIRYPWSPYRETPIRDVPVSTLRWFIKKVEYDRADIRYDSLARAIREYLDDPPTREREIFELSQPR